MAPGQSNSRAERRMQRFAEIENAKVPEERMMNRDDFEDTVFKNMSASRMRSFEQVKEWFVEFATHDNIKLCTEEEAWSYFRPGGTIFTLKVVRQFFTYLAMSREGFIIDPSSGRKLLHSNTLVSYLFILEGAAARSLNPIERDVIQSTIPWIRYRMVDEGLANTLSKVKPVSMPKDVTTLLKAIFSVRYMATLRNSREALNLALFANMFTDCSNRTGELVQQGSTGKYLRWKRIRFVAIQENDNAPVRVYASILFAELKSWNGDVNKHKTIPLRLLPLSLAAEDTLRLLLTVAFLDSIFKKINNWDDIQKLRPGPNGRFISMKDEVLELPVFRATSWHKVLDDPLSGTWIRRHLRSASIFAGFAVALICAVLRRGAAYLLKLHASPEERRLRMGHSDSRTYEAYYQNTTSTLDLQGCRTGVPTENLELLSALSTGLRPDAPVRISEEGRRIVYADSRLVEARSKAERLLDEFVTVKQKNETKVAIQQAQKDYQSAAHKVRNLQIQITQEIFEQEYQAWFAQDCPMSQDDDQPACPQGLDPLEPDEMPLDGDVDAIVDDGHVAAAAFFLDNESDDEEEADGYIDKRRQQKGMHKEVIRLKTLADDVQDVMFGITEMDEISLGTYMLVAFNRMHPVDMFSPGQEPLPGSWCCRFCNASFGDEVEFYQVHAKACAKKFAIERAEKALNALGDLNSPCTWVHRGGKQCNKLSFLNGTEIQSHITRHCNEAKENGQLVCRFGSCRKGPGSCFKSKNAFLSHILHEHSMSTAAGAPGSRNAAKHIEYCGCCDSFVSEFDQPFEEHFGTHRHEISSLVADYGYAGLMIATQPIRPPLCIFCVHDSSLAVRNRFRTLSSTSSLLDHLYAIHIKDMGGPSYCPASVSTDSDMAHCSDSSLMNEEAMRKHLKIKHGLEIPQIESYNKPSRKNKLKSTEDADGEQVSKVSEAPALRKEAISKKEHHPEVIVISDDTDDEDDIVVVKQPVGNSTRLKRRNIVSDSEDDAIQAQPSASFASFQQSKTIADAKKNRHLGSNETILEGQPTKMLGLKGQKKVPFGSGGKPDQSDDEPLVKKLKGARKVPFGSGHKKDDSDDEPMGRGCPGKKYRHVLPPKLPNRN